MGINDREYIRDEPPSAWLSNRSMVVNLILLNVAVYVAEVIWGEGFQRALSLHADLFQAPWQVWQLVSYGFVHDFDFRHILFNMFGLWIFGTDLEALYGRAELLRFYLLTLIVTGMAWVVYEAVNGAVLDILLGASGGVMGLMIVWVLNFPRRTLYLMGILPLPGWAIGAMYVFFDLADLGSADNVAHVAHLSGVAFGAIYFQSGIRLDRLIPRRLSASMFRLRPRLRIHSPEEETRELGQQVDEILAKISQQGEASLTKKERRTLEEASRRYQRRRQ